MFSRIPKRQLLARTRLLSFSRNTFERNYSTKSPRGDELPSFKKIAVVGLLGTVIFVQTVKSIEKRKPKTSYSEAEFENTMAGLRRRIVLFPQGQFNLNFVLPGVRLKAQQLEGDQVKVISPSEVIEYYRTLAGSKYEALLNDLRNQHGPESYAEKLPPGMTVMLLGRYMKEKCSPGDTLYIIDFPTNIKDAIKFENEVAVVNAVFASEKDQDSDIIKYYQTVEKVEVV